MKKHFYFSAIVCVLLSVFVFSADAIHSQQEENAKTLKEGAWKRASNANQTLLSARLVMSKIGTYYDLNAKEINKGKRMTLGSVLKGAATVTVTYVTGGSTVAVTVLTSIEPTLKIFGLYSSINTQSDLESAYESAISQVISCISDASQAVTTYLHLWDDYRVEVINHNSQYHGSGSSPSDPAHEIEPYEPPKVDTSLTTFRCPGGGCNITYDYPSSAREVHFAQCGTKDDPYDTWLAGCNDVYYTCNTKEKVRHKPNDCGLERWISTTHGWAKTVCTGDYRKCTQHSQLHATVLGTNQISMCLPAESSSPVVSPTPTPTPTDGTPNCSDCTSHCSSPCSCTNSGTCGGTVTDSTPNCPDCTSHCSSPCSCTNSGTCNGSVYTPPSTPSTPPTPPPTPSTPVIVACGGASWTDCRESVSSRTEHKVSSCSNCGKHYWTCMSGAVERHTEVKTCKRTGCGASLTRCQNGPEACSINGGYHWL